MRYAKLLLTLFTILLLKVSSQAQTLTDMLLPRYVQGVGGASTTLERRVPFVCRLTVSGLVANKTYRYYNKFIDDPTNTSLTGEGGFVIVTQSGNFIRTTAPNLSTANRYGTFTTDATGSFTGWFAGEPNTATLFMPGRSVYFRLTLNDGNDGTAIDRFVTCNTPVTTLNFGDTPADGTALRSTAAAQGVAKNFVFLYDNAAGAGRPVTGTLIEADGVNNNAASAFYAPFYANEVNEKDKNWGTIIPNNLANGIQRITQYALADASVVGFKTSATGNWAQDGGGTVSTVNATGGLTTVLVLDGAVVDLGPATKQPQTITFNTLAATTYGEADLDPGATASSSLAVAYSSSNTAVASIVNGKIHITGAGTADITAEQAGDGDYLAATPVVQTLTVNKANLTIKADNQVKVQGDPLPANFTVQYTGFVNSEDASVFTTPLVVTTTATQNALPGTYSITPSGATAANYNISFVEGVLTVNSSRQPQTIIFGAIGAKTYGSTPFPTGATISSGLQIDYTSSDPSVAVVINGQVQIKGTGTTTITATHPGNANFEPANDVSQVLTVDKAALSVKADHKSRLVGQANPVLTVVYTGFQYGDTNTVFTVQPTIQTSATAASTAGDYPITVGGAVAANYTITYVAGVLTVLPLPAQTITFPALPAKTYGQGAFSAGATASSGLKVRYTSSNTSVATVDEEGVILLTGAGTVNITATQPGDAFNAAAPDVVRVLNVAKVNLVIRVKDTSRNEGQPNPAFELQYAGFVNGDDEGKLTTQATVSTTATTGSVPGRYTLTVSGATSGNYNIAQVAGDLIVLPPQGSAQDNLNAFMGSPGQLRVNIYSVEAGRSVIQLFDQQANRLLQVNVTLVKGSNSFQLPVNNIPAGIYHVRVDGPGFSLKSKAVIR